VGSLILVDNREPDAIKSLFTRDAEIMRLEYGDFAFDGNGPNGSVIIGVERKSINDLINSIKDKRLSGRQVPGIMMTYDVGVLLVEGEWESSRAGMVMVKGANNRWRKTGMVVGALKGYLFSLMWMCGMQVIYTKDHQDTVNHIKCMAAWWGKKWESHSSHKAVTGLTMKDDTSIFDIKFNIVARMSYQIQGLGMKRAKAAGEVFGRQTPLSVSKTAHSS